MTNPLKNDLLIRTLRGEKTERTPVWMMRQAGRYLPDYQKLKAKYSFFERCKNPELATQRIRETYRAKGYSDEWIERRMRGIAVRDELTGEWQRRGVKEGKEYAILTAEISKATFGMTPSEYKALKRLDRPDENLRDHMSDLELIFTMLGEASTTEIARKRDAKGFDKNKRAAMEGGAVAGNARRELEQRSGRRVTNTDNFKTLPERKRRQLKKNDE